MASRTLVKKLFIPACLGAVIFTLLSLISCERGQEAGAPQEIRTDSFTFLGLHAASTLSGSIRENLDEKLGSAAVETNTTLDLTPAENDLLQQYLPDLYRLNTKLNSENGVKLRIEHPTVKIIYRYSAIFDYVELFFTKDTRRPLLFRIRAKKDGSGYLQTFQKKYGPPQEIARPQNGARFFIWKHAQDVLLISLFTDLYNNPQFEIMICYTANIEAMMTAEEKKKKEESRLPKGQGVF